MGTTFYYQSRLWCVCSTVAVILISGTLATAEEQSSRVRRLTYESANKKAIDESSLLNENPLMRSDIREALGYIKKHGDYTSYHLLLAIRKYYPAYYKEISDGNKAAILCSGLDNSIHLNDWGYLAPSRSFDGASAEALLETGKAAVNSLTFLIDNDKPASLFGSKEHTMSSIYQYRRKDFAYRYLCLILGNQPAFRADARERDREIERFKRKLANDAR